MIDQIKQLEAISRQLEPDTLQRDQLIKQVVAHSQTYMDGINDAPANYPFEDGRSLYESPISEEGIDIDQALSLIKNNIDQSGISTTSGRFMGFIPGGAIFPAALGDYLAAVSNRYAGHFFASPSAVRLENMLISWMADVVGYDGRPAGSLTSGGSLANLTAVVTARDSHDIAGDRLPKSVIYLTEHTHHSIDKAVHMAGLSTCISRRVPVDDRFRMDAAALRKAIETDRKNGLNPFLVVAAAGTTNTGSVDPLQEIAAIAAGNDLWFHCDGAYGAFFNLCPEGQAILKGMEEADSVVMDPHKTLFLPYGSGALLVKDGAKLYASQNWGAAYMQDVPDDIEELSPADLSPELTKHFRGLRMWLPLKLFGVAPFRAALSEKIHLTRYFHQQLLQVDQFEVGPFPDLSVVTYRYLPKRGDVDAFNEKLTRKIQQDGRIYISSTRIDGKFVLRLAVSSFRTHLSDIDEALDVLCSTAKHIAESN